MNRKHLLAAICLTSAVAAVTVGCQTYDFQPVEPLALAQDGQVRDLKVARVRPNIMMLVDKSGSMNQPADPSDPDCQVAGGTCPQGATLCPATCPTRWSELQGAIDSFFATAENQTLARFGIATYPTNAVCGDDTSNPSQLRVNIPSSDVDADVAAAATQVNGVIQGIQMVPGVSMMAGTENATGGGTPTGYSLRQLGNLPELNSEREDVILLLTDGLPNCNPDNPNHGETSPLQCKCTLAGCTDAAGTARLGCLDADGTVAEIAALNAKGIKTAVVGLGSETGTGDGPAVLTAMAAAGGFSRYYQANNGAELADAIEAIGIEVTAEHPCHFKLAEVPQSVDYISVLVGPSDGPLERAASGPETWRLENAADFTGSLPPSQCTGGVPCVVLQGQLCADVEASSALDPLRIEVRALYPL